MSALMIQLIIVITMLQREDMPLKQYLLGTS